MTSNNATQRKADRGTLTAISRTLSDIKARAAEGQPVYATMAASIDARHALHMEGACQPDSCPLCLGTGMTMEDQNI